MSADHRAGPDMEIRLHFTVSLMDGTVMDSTRGREPATFVWGDGSLLPGFEQAIRGLRAGDERSVYLAPEQGFGERNPDNIQHFPDNTFDAGLELEPGAVVNFADASGAELPGVITGHEDGWVTVDFNHPLAGRELTFSVEIIDVRPHQPAQPVKIK